MSQLRKYPFAYLAALCAALALGFFFLPGAYAQTLEGTRIYIYGFTLAFGGEIVTEVGGTVYSMSFSINIFALVLLMCLFLGTVAALLSKESFINRLAAAALAGAGAVLMLLLPFKVGQTGLHHAYGAFLCAGFATLSVAFDLLGFAFSKRK